MSIVSRLWIALDETSKKKADISELLNINSSTIGNWQTRNTDPPAKYIVPICEYLGISVMWLLTGNGDIFENEVSSNGEIDKESITVDEEMLLDRYRHLSRQSKKEILDTIIELSNEETPKSKEKSKTSSYSPGEEAATNEQAV